MSYYCFKCGNEVSLEQCSSVPRSASCPKCHADLHACLNCKHYDQRAYNECHEPQAERVLDKERSNFCDYFAFRESDKPGLQKPDPKEGHLKKLDDLFKK